MNDFHLEPLDELPHTPAKTITNFNESVYTNGFDATTKVGGWMRLGNRPNEGHAELQVCLYLPGNRVACQFRRPRIDSHDVFSAGGLSYRVVEPYKCIAMDYEGEFMLLDDPNLLRDPAALFSQAKKVNGAVNWIQSAVSPMHGGTPTSEMVEPYYGRDFSLSHFNQHMKVNGSVRIGGESWEIDGTGWRDHSWGPRYWTNIYFHRLLIANFDNGNGMMLLKITDRNNRTRRLGVLLVDGEYEEVVDMDLTTKWDRRKDPASYTVLVRTAKRSAIIKGKVITGAPLRNRRPVGEEILVSRIFEGATEFRWGSATGYGMTEYIERIENGGLVGYPF